MPENENCSAPATVADTGANDAWKDRLELEVRRTLSSEIASHRDYLEKLINQLKWAAGVIAVIATGIFLYFNGKTYSEITDQSRKLVEDRMIDYRIRDELKLELNRTITNFIGSDETNKILTNTVQKTVGRLVNAEAEGNIQRVISKKADELNIKDFSKNIVSLPVSSIISSILSPDVFVKVAGDINEFDPRKSLWILADGREVKDSTYAKLLNVNYVPDLRGMFLRGMNSGRQDGNQDPETRDVSTYEVDSFKAHSHTMGTGGADSKEMASDGGVQRLSSFYKENFNFGAPKTTDSTGGSETRPRNVSVYYYIRIN